MWFEFCHNSQTQWPYLGKRAPEVDQYDISWDEIPQPDMDTDCYTTVGVFLAARV